MLGRLLPLAKARLRVRSMNRPISPGQENGGIHSLSASGLRAYAGNLAASEHELPSLIATDPVT